jgi:hypothetical protein
MNFFAGEYGEDGFCGQLSTAVPVNIVVCSLFRIITLCGGGGDVGGDSVGEEPLHGIKGLLLLLLLLLSLPPPPPPPLSISRSN